MFKPGDFKIEKIILSNGKGFEEDITKLVLEMSLYESIMTKTVEAELTILDSFDLYSSVPLSGGELVNIVFKSTPYSDNDDMFSTIDITLEVFKLSGQKLGGNGQSSQYSLYLCSPEYVTNNKIKLSEVVVGQGHKIVASVFNSYLNNSDKQLLEIKESSTNLQKFICPYWTPYKLFDWVCKRCRGDLNSSNPSFIFYQNHDKHIFTNFGQMSSSSPIATYKMNQSGINKTENGSHPDFYMITKPPDFKEKHDRLTQLNKGMFASEMTVIDSTRKSTNTVAYNYQNQYDKHQHLNKNKLIESSDTLYSNYSKSNISFLHNTTDLHENIFDNELYEGWYLTRKSILSQHESDSVTITVYGNSNIHCGDVVEINIPKRTVLESSTDVYNQYMSGKYIALNVRHSIVNIPEGNYMTIIDLIKDSFVNPIPDITNLETK